MKVLHISHEKLPDWRVEKSAITGSKFGYSVYFAGEDSLNYKSDIFKKIVSINWSSKARFGIPYYYHMLKKQVKYILDEIRPDIIHAHNLFAAKISSEFDYPLVYDDHEYWSDHVRLLFKRKRFIEIKKIRDFEIYLRNNFIIPQWIKWEDKLITNYQTVTVSNQIIKELRKYGVTKSIYFVPNYPTEAEINDLITPYFHESFSSIYSGSDGYFIEKQPHRNMEGFIELFNFNKIGNLTILGWTGESTEKVCFKGRLERGNMYKEMTNHSVGILPWKQHQSHRYVNPNKVYEYAHAGLMVICTSDFLEIQDNLDGHVITFDSYEELTEILKDLSTNLQELYKRRIALFKYAREKLLWENYERNIITAYSKS
ncbi:MAG TPA: glycosyltransferase [Nitrososphaeraceae archaeon]|nr:glycosyltransferase [Nitrososphaeraceae archaeon]